MVIYIYIYIHRQGKSGKVTVKFIYYTLPTPKGDFESLTLFLEMNVSPEFLILNAVRTLNSENLLIKIIQSIIQQHAVHLSCI